MTQDKPSDSTEYLNSNIYEWKLDRARFAVILEHFYATTNIDRIRKDLSKNGFDFFANDLKEAESRAAIREMIKVETVPKFTNLSMISKKNPAHLTGAMSSQTSLLNISITGKSKEKFNEISNLIRKNFENNIITDSTKKMLKQNKKNIFHEIERIDNERIELDLKVQKESFLLDKYRALGSSDRVGMRSSQFIIEDTEYLSVNFQIDASEIRLINHEGDRIIKDKQRETLRRILDLNEILMAKLDEPVPANFKEQDLLSHIDRLLKENTEPGQVAYLRNLAEKIDGIAAMVKPVTMKPNIYVVDKNIYKKSGIVFAVMFIATSITAFLVEGYKKYK